MKLTDDLKRKIDDYFDNVSAEELYQISTNKYNFVEKIVLVEYGSFDTIKKSIYTNADDDVNIETTDNIISLAA
jgi:hypothetical protein